MGFFSHFNPFKAVSRVIQPVLNNPIKATRSAISQVAANPLRFGAAIATVGLSEAARVAPIIGKPFQKLQAFEQSAYDLAANVYTGGLYGQVKQIGNSILQPTGAPMSLNLGGILQATSQIFGNNQNPYFQTIGNIANLGSQFVPQPQQVAMRPPQASAGLPAITAGAAVARGFFNRFPNLAVSMQQLRARGHKVKRGQLWNLLKRFGPEVLITGGLLTAAAVSELMVAGPGRRTMNPANAKALRRAARRIKGFHKLCGTVDLLKSRGKRASVGRRCGTCRKSPCSC